MAKGPFPPLDALHYGGGGGGGGSKLTATTLKRKTPSELRGEMLKQKNIMEIVDESPAPIIGSIGNTYGISGLKRADPSKNPRYIDTRMDELFPVRKNSMRLKLLSKRENTKDEQMGSLKKPSAIASESPLHGSCLDDSLASTSAEKVNTEEQNSNKTRKCSSNFFRSVTELSQNGEQFTGLSTVDMDKALKGLIPRESFTFPSSHVQSEGNYIPKLPSEFQISGKNTPLDLTLKTSMRVISSSSVSWFHRLVNCGNNTHISSWVYPQSSLPSTVISALSLASVRGGQMDFLSKRQQDWEESFRSIYYMLRKNHCNIFYVCTAPFIVMFTGPEGKKVKERSCNAYISQSTRTLRSLLKQHDVCFSMPLCKSMVEEDTVEDLVELSEIEKQNLGQTRKNTVSMSDVDNTPESLLVFSGNKNVHALYDFLLNYRLVLTSLTGMDVPILYSPIPFQNAALTAPEVRCKELRKTGNNQGISYSVDITDVYLPPWVICSVSEAIIGCNETSFEASFVTEQISMGLNVGLDKVDEICEDEGLKKRDNVFGIGNAKHCSHMRSVFVKGFKYSGGSYTVSVGPV